MYLMPLLGHIAVRSQSIGIRPAVRVGSIPRRLPPPRPSENSSQ
jgi:hypothetical protein